MRIPVSATGLATAALALALAPKPTPTSVRSVTQPPVFHPPQLRRQHLEHTPLGIHASDRGAAWIYSPFSRPDPPDTPSPSRDHAQSDGGRAAGGWSTGQTPSPFLPTPPSSPVSTAVSATPVAPATPAAAPEADVDVITPMQVAIYQADLQVAAFKQAVENISPDDLDRGGWDATSLAQFMWMAETSVAHRALLQTQLTSHGGQVPTSCTYNFRFKGVPDFLDYMILSLQNGVSGLLGTLSSGVSSDVATLVASIAAGTSGMLQLLRQFRGLWPDPVTVPPVLPVSYFWALVAQDILSCPDGSPVPELPLYPRLDVSNMPAYPARAPTLGAETGPSLTVPNASVIQLTWQPPGQLVGPFKQTARTTIVAPTHALFLAESLLLTVPLPPVNVTSASTQVTLVQPLALQVNDTVFGQLDLALNGTVYIALVDTPLTDRTAVDAHTFSGPVAYRAG